MDDIVLLLGKLDGRLESTQSDVNEIKESIKCLTKTISNRPCEVHEARISTIETWRGACNGLKQESYKAWLNVRTMIVGGALITIINIVIGIILRDVM